MKSLRSFRLSSLLLFAALLGLTVALFTERVRSKNLLKKQKAEFDRQFDEIWGGVYTYGQTSQLIYNSRAYKLREQESDYQKYLENALIYAMISLWKREKSVDAAWDDETQAITMGNDILNILDCYDADSFFALARRSEGYNGENVEYFQEIHDGSSDQHRSFRDFVERSVGAAKITKRGH